MGHGLPWPPHLFRVPSSRCRGTLYVQYELQRELGEGAFGKAILARRRRDGELFVVKMMHGAGLTEKAREEVKPPSLGPC
jgi:hypothetical protein